MGILYTTDNEHGGFAYYDERSRDGGQSQMPGTPVLRPHYAKQRKVLPPTANPSR